MAPSQYLACAPVVCVCHRPRRADASQKATKTPTAASPPWRSKSFDASTIADFSKWRRLLAAVRADRPAWHPAAPTWGFLRPSRHTTRPVWDGSFFRLDAPLTVLASCRSFRGTVTSPEELCRRARALREPLHLRHSYSDIATRGQPPGDRATLVERSTSSTHRCPYVWIANEDKGFGLNVIVLRYSRSVRSCHPPRQLPLDGPPDGLVRCAGSIGDTVRLTDADYTWWKTRLQHLRLQPRCVVTPIECVPRLTRRRLSRRAVTVPRSSCGAPGRFASAAQGFRSVRGGVCRWRRLTVSPLVRACLGR